MYYVSIQLAPLTKCADEDLDLAGWLESILFTETNKMFSIPDTCTYKKSNYCLGCWFMSRTAAGILKKNQLVVTSLLLAAATLFICWKKFLYEELNKKKSIISPVHDIYDNRRSVLPVPYCNYGDHSQQKQNSSSSRDVDIHHVERQAKAAWMWYVRQ